MTTTEAMLNNLRKAYELSKNSEEIKKIIDESLKQVAVQFLEDLTDFHEGISGAIEEEERSIEELYDICKKEYNR